MKKKWHIRTINGNTMVCKCSTGICGSTTLGSGRLDDFGYWEFPCPECAREMERMLPEYGQCWPFANAELAEVKP